MIYSLDALEFGKIKDLIKAKTFSPLTKAVIDEISPFSDQNSIESGYSYIKELKVLSASMAYLPLMTILDIGPALKKIEIKNYILSPEELVEISFDISIAFEIIAFLKEQKDEIPHLRELGRELSDLGFIQKRIDNCIDREDFSILDTASPELAKLRKQKQRLLGSIRKWFEDYMSSSKGKRICREDNFTIREGRFVLPVKHTQKKSVKGIVHDKSATAQTIYIEPQETIDLNNDVRDIEIAEKQEIQRILSELSALVAQFRDKIELNLETLTKFDFINSKFLFGEDLCCSVPIIRDTNRFMIKKGYHPLLLYFNNKKNLATVPIDIEIKDDVNTIIISGANMGGKTVALKTVALLSLMVQSAIPVPVSPNSEFGIFDNIMADIGDHQSIEENLSTFSSHLTNIGRILDNANNRSLILLDELGAGTDPEEGSAFALSVLKFLNARDAKTLITTHYNSLKVFANDNDKFINASVYFDIESMSPAYRIQMGIPGNSYAFEIVNKIGLNAEVIKSFRDFMGEERYKITNLITTLEENIKNYEKLVFEVGKKERELDIVNEELNYKLKNWKKEEYKLKSDAINTSKKYLDGLNKEFEGIIKDLRENRDLPDEVIKEKIRDYQVKYKKRKTEVRKKIRKFPRKHELIPLENPEPGGKAWIDTFNCEGVIKNVTKKQVEVLVNNLLFKVKPENLFLIEKQLMNKPDEKVKGYSRYNRAEYSTSIDLRGEYSYEALKRVDKFLDDAYLNGISMVKIVHGVGSGKLHKEITLQLKSDGRVNDFRLGEKGEGGAGVTIVNLKN